MQELEGVCIQRDCRRRCHVDLERWAARGFAAVRIDYLKRQLKCARMDGCALDFHARPAEPLLPLRALIGRPRVQIRIRCQGCKFFRSLTVEALIVRLKEQKTGSEDTNVTEVVGAVRGPCKACGKRAWRVDVLWPDPRSEGVRRPGGG